jgi:hypothetical protein
LGSTQKKYPSTSLTPQCHTLCLGTALPSGPPKLRFELELRRVDKTKVEPAGACGPKQRDLATARKGDFFWVDPKKSQNGSRGSCPTWDCQNARSLKETTVLFSLRIGRVFNNRC